jgi:hypothetical protein
MQQLADTHSKATSGLPRTSKGHQRKSNKSKRRNASGNKNGSIIQIRKGKPIKDFIKQLKQHESAYMAKQQTAEKTSSPGVAPFS